MDTLLTDLRAVSVIAPRVLLRVANTSGEHFYAGYSAKNDYGLPTDARVHLSIAPSGLKAMWMKGDVPHLLLLLMNWAAGRQLLVRLEHRMEFDETGQLPIYALSLWDVEERVRAEARDPLTALLRTIVLNSELDV